MLVRWLERRLKNPAVILILLSWMLVFYVTRYSDISYIERQKASAENRIRMLERELFQARYLLTERDRELFMTKKTAQLCSNDTSNPKPSISVPSLFDFLPHLYSGASNALRPAVSLPNETFPKETKLVIGIPTVARHNFSYLLPTLQSLMSAMNSEEKVTTVLVVLIADEDGATSPFVLEQLRTVRTEFAQEVKSGLLHLIVPPREWYPSDMRSIPQTFGDTAERMYWRTKQNLDYVFLMLYCQRRGEYYLQLEDDVLTKPGFVSKIHDFIAQRTDDDWMMLEFSSLGFIGKLFKTSDLPLLAQFIVLFHREKPVDWLLDLLFVNRYCHPEKSPKKCTEVSKQFRIRSRPSLFQHVGVHSSLAGKLQKLRERDFGKAHLYVPHKNNPPAKLSTTLEAYKSYNLEGAYQGVNFFWCFSPHAGDYILFEFEQSVQLRGFLFRTGSPDHQSDILSGNGVVYMRIKEGKEFVKVTEFNEHGTARADWANGTKTVMEIEALKIVINTDTTHWIIFNEIFINAA